MALLHSGPTFSISDSASSRVKLDGVESTCGQPVGRELGVGGQLGVIARSEGLRGIAPCLASRLREQMIGESAARSIPSRMEQWPRSRNHVPASLRAITFATTSRKHKERSVSKMCTSPTHARDG
eukprot:scaffold52748_cov60-Phaeocystis_antarctica.AAC.3